jgi:hypothetical protein
MSKDSKPKQTKKEHSPFTQKPSEPEVKPSSNLHSDFASVSAVSRHVRDLTDDDKIKFAAKYGIQYKDVSGIRGSAKTKYNTSS